MTLLDLMQTEVLNSHYLLMFLSLRDIVPLQILTKAVPPIAPDDLLRVAAQELSPHVDISSLRRRSTSIRDLSYLVSSLAGQRLTWRPPVLTLPAPPQARQLAKAVANAKNMKHFHERATGCGATVVVGRFKLTSQAAQRLPWVSSSSRLCYEPPIVAANMQSSMIVVPVTTTSNQQQKKKQTMGITMAISDEDEILLGAASKPSAAHVNVIQALEVDLVAVCEGATLRLKDVFIRPGRQWSRACGLVFATDHGALTTAATSEGILCCLCVKEVEEASREQTMQTSTVHALGLDAPRKAGQHH